jgi:hypothetical protein
MMLDLSGIWVIEPFEFRICFGQFYKIRRASDFDFAGQTESKG